MPADQLGIGERSALLALMAEARAVPNPELEEITGSPLYGKHRRRLNDRGLVESYRDRSRAGRPYVHALTAEGWEWCRAELTAGVPDRAGSAGGALYAVLAGLRRHLDRSGLDLPDIFQPDGAGPPSAQPPPAEQPLAEQPLAEQPLAEQPSEQPADLTDRIRTGYRKLAKDPRDLVSLTELRPLLGGAPREAVDGALRQLSRTRQANLVPQANQKILSQADRAAAVRIGNEDCHLISMDSA